ncbi:ANTAR domain-containing protein [uncultured Pseudokineococcus sp.]|uniref:ANTAR domain-containing protein n=1 Tax=uncultured Pseudokineococcus sp. TaxID=1642928 RepID=UPI0026079E74|nr:ANTAR domain-containing protein [uncultured Pseudokineococcus sp.]
MTDVDPDALRAGLARLQQLAASAETPTGTTTADTLGEILSSLRSALPLASAGLMLRDPDGRLTCVAWTGSASRTLEEAEDEVVSGPATDAQVLGIVRASADVTVDPRWPTLGPALSGEPAAPQDELPAGIDDPASPTDGGTPPERATGGGSPRAVATVPVSVAGGPVGCLVAVREEARAWEPSQLEVLESSARLAAGLLQTAAAAESTGRLAEQLQHALDHRVVVERAVGYLMAQQDVDATAAFGALRRASRSARRRVADVAEAVLSLGGLEAAAGAVRAPAG